MNTQSQMPSLLAVTSELPWPLDSGGHIRTFHLLRSLTSGVRVRLVAGVTPSDQAHVAALEAAGIAVITARIPDRTTRGEAVRAVKAIAAGEPYVMYRRHDQRAIRSALHTAVTTDPPDALYLDHLDSMLFADVAGRSRVIVDLHNVYSLLVERAAAEHRNRVSAMYLKREARLLAGIERRVAARADLLMTVSDREAGYFCSLGARNTIVVPNGVDCAAYSSLPLGRPLSDAPIVLFVGGLSWAPNVSAAQFLAAEMLPALRRHFPRATLKLVGRGPSQGVFALGGLPGVELVGPVDDVRPYLRDASLLAVPLDAGGGTRLKILEAFAAGLPVVSTAIGCEGIAAEHERHLIVAERPVFAEAIQHLLRDPDAARTRAARARQLAFETYDWRVVGTGALSAIRNLL